MTGFKNVLSGIGHFVEKLFKNEKVQDALEDAGKAAALEIAEFAHAKAKETKTNVDDLLATAVLTALNTKPVDPDKLNQ